MNLFAFAVQIVILLQRYNVGSELEQVENEKRLCMSDLLASLRYRWELKSVSILIPIWTKKV